MNHYLKYYSLATLILVFSLFGSCQFRDGNSGADSKKFKVLGFYNELNESESAHLAVIREANKWFTEMGKKYNFEYDSTNSRNVLNCKFLADYKVVIFFDRRPDSLPHREAFQKYIENGGGRRKSSVC